MEEEKVLFTFRFNKTTMWVPKSFAASMEAQYKQYDKEQEPGYVKPTPSENATFRKTLRVAVVDNHELIYIDPLTNKGYEYDNTYKVDDPLKPVEYTEFKRWARGMDF